MRLRFPDPLEREEDLKTVKVRNPIKREREKIKVMLFSEFGSLGEWVSLFLGHTKNVFVGPVYATQYLVAFWPVSIV